MLRSALHLLFAPVIGLWLRISTRSWRQLPTPGERPVAFAAGPNADRVLLVGAGIAVGYGVSSGDLALGGQLARRLASLTGRGASIETVARFGLRAREAPEVLKEFDLGRFDAVMLTLGSNEALYLMPIVRFRSDMSQLLDWLDVSVPARFGVVVVGIPDLPSMMMVPRAFRNVIRHHCARLDAELKELCRRHARVTYLPFVPEPGDLERDGDRHMYEAWAELIAPTVARVLDAQVADPRDPATIQERRRQSALDGLRILDTAAEHRFDQIVADARDLFGVRGASITFIDCERQWSKATVGMSPADSPRGSALGDATVQNGKLLVVEDASRDPRFAGHPWVAGTSAIRFFAGFPIEASNGERVGALCITDTRPRSFSTAEDALLGMLARRVQLELWGTPVSDADPRRTLSMDDRPPR
ncbi:hypothetical protein BH09ACT5_BH09ACT5_09600 [soil metagenome]